MSDTDLTQISNSYSDVGTALQNLLENMQSVFIPVGTILPYSGTDAPTGFFLCNGAPYDTSVYESLYDKINKNTVPDLRGMFLRGLDTTGAADRDGKTRSLLSFQEGTRVFHEGTDDVMGLFSKNPIHAPYTNSNLNTMSNLGLDPLSDSSELHELWLTQPALKLSEYVNDNIKKNLGIVNNYSTPYGPWDMISTSRPKNVAVNYIIKAV